VENLGGINTLLAVSSLVAVNSACASVLSIGDHGCVTGRARDSQPVPFCTFLSPTNGIVAFGLLEGSQSLLAEDL